MILVIDNYDSFVENLARYVRELGQETFTVRNDAITLNEIEKLNPSHIILSPGPCSPDDAGICLALISHFAGKIPILGVCLGHQAVGQAFGAKVVQAIKPMHGKTSLITHDQKNIFENVFTPLTVARYHSLIVEDIPECLEVTATSKEGEVMALQHRKYSVYGVQFHPESFLTEHGYDLIDNFLRVE